MSHLHVPDGVLPVALWAPGLALALLLLLPATLATRKSALKTAGFRAALGGLMLAVMSIPIPLFAMEYCLTLAGPVGVLVGVAAGFPIGFIVSVILALLGQGGLTVVGLNALVLGAGMAVARPAYLALRGGLGPAAALAGATALAQVASGATWFALLAIALRLSPGIQVFGEHGHAAVPVFAGITLLLWGVAIAAEATVAFGIVRFLARVRPDLLPGPPGGPAT